MNDKPQPSDTYTPTPHNGTPTPHNGEISGLASTPPQPVRARNRTMLAITGIALLSGMLGGAWLMKSYGPHDVASNRPVTADVAPANPTPSPVTDAVAQPLAAVPAPTDMLAESSAEANYSRARIAELERRLAELNQQAAEAGGNASRAEGLLVAFAARRAIERGLALGYIENELRRRFGDAMPRAVATIIDASKFPVTADKLSERLDALSPKLLSDAQADEGFWANARREIGQLFVVRAENSTYVDPAQRLTRAKRALDIGRVDRAIAEVQNLPGAAGATQWLASARRYNEAQRALDLIESAAIQDPANLRDLGTTAADPAEKAPTPAPVTQ